MNPQFYGRHYDDLYQVFGMNVQQLLRHYEDHGRNEGRHISHNDYIDFCSKIKKCLDNKNILILNHHFGGGANEFVNDLCRFLSDYNIFIIYSHGNHIVLQIRLEEISLSAMIPIDQFTDWISQNQIKFNLIIINHIITFNLSTVEKIIDDLKCPYLTILHEYFWISQDIFLMNPLDIDVFRISRHKKLLDGSSKIIAASVACASINYAFLRSSITVIPHSQLELIGSSVYSLPEEIKIAFVGEIPGPHKGGDRLLQIDQNVSKWGNQTYYLIGRNNINLKHIQCTGWYDGSPGFNAFFDQIKPDIICLVSSSQETYSYTLDYALTTGRPIVLPSLLTYQERSSQYKNLYIYPDTFKGLEIIEFIRHLPSKMSVNTYQIKHKINPKYRDLVDEIESKSMMSSDSWKKLYNKFSPWEQFKRYNTECMCAGIFTQEDVWNSQTLPKSEYCFYRGSHDVVDLIHERLCRETYELRLNQIHRNSSENSRAAIIIEPRKHPMFEPVIRNVMNHLGSGWNLYVFTNLAAGEYLQKKLSGWEYRMIDIQVDNLNAATYSQLMYYPDFWNNFHEENILIFQTDALIVDRLRINLEDYLDFSYVGAAHDGHFGGICMNTPQKIGLNGGFSLRRKSRMLEVIDKISFENIDRYRQSHGLDAMIFYQNGSRYLPEDAYFYHGIEMLEYPFPSMDHISRFCVQDVFYEKPYSIHGFYHGYLNNDQIKKILSS